MRGTLYGELFLSTSRNYDVNKSVQYTFPGRHHFKACQVGLEGWREGGRGGVELERGSNYYFDIHTGCPKESGNMDFLAKICVLEP